MTYGELVEGKLELAPNTFKTENGVLTRPSHLDYKARKYKPVLHTKPHKDAPKGLQWVQRGYVETANDIRTKWVLAKLPPRVFSKMKAVLALKELGVWEQVKSWIDGAGLTDVFLAAQAFREDDPFFKKGLAALKEQLKLTDEQIESLLANCVGEG